MRRHPLTFRYAEPPRISLPIRLRGRSLSAKKHTRTGLPRSITMGRAGATHPAGLLGVVGRASQARRKAFQIIFHLFGLQSYDGYGRFLKAQHQRDLGGQNGRSLDFSVGGCFGASP